MNTSLANSTILEHPIQNMYSFSLYADHSEVSSRAWPKANKPIVNYLGCLV